MGLSFNEEFTGRVLRPGDAEYDEARTVFYGIVDGRPAAIVQAADAEDVARAVREAARTGSELAIRSGGHSIAGHSTTDGGILLDLRGLTSLEVDREEREAWAGTGLTAGAYTDAVGKYGLATGFGDTGTVGIGGLTTGGGVGFLARRYGLTIDSVLAAEVVTADGRILVADAENEPELFWSIRGGLGNTGVVTRFRYRLHEVDEITGGVLMLPGTPEVVAEVMALSEAAEEDLTTIVMVMPAPPMPFIPAEHHGRTAVMILLAHVGSPADGAKAVDRLRAVAKPIVDMARPIRYPELFQGGPPEPEHEDGRPTAIGYNFFLDRPVDEAMAATIIEHLGRTDAQPRAAQLRVLGGAVSRVPADATAYAHRDRPMMVNLGVYYHGAEDEARQRAWLNGFRAALDPAPGSYGNFVGLDGDIHDVFPGETYDRLAAAKRRYDPDNLFRRNHNVPPA